MRYCTPSRVARGLCLVLVFYLVLKFFPGLPFLNLKSLGLRSGATFLANSLIRVVPEKWLSPRGSWLKQLEMSEADFHHLEHYCEGPRLNETRDRKETLLAVQMLIRHGDRGALFAVKDESHISCPFDESHSLPDTFLAYYHAASSAATKSKTSAAFSHVPGMTGCLKGELTSKGVIQHLQLGSSVRARLGENSERWSLETVTVHSTYYPRTYQSALAFMHGLDPATETIPRKIEIAPPGDHMFCTMAHTCNCKTSKNIGAEYNRLSKELFELSPEKVSLTSRLLGIIGSHLERPIENRPTHVFDVLLQFACHGKRMPCFEGTCVTYHELVDVITLLENLSQKLSALPAVREFCILDAYGLLHTVTENLQAIANGNMSKTPEKRFTLFSAHDSTVVPVMTALGLPFRIVIPYASFVMFELYSVAGDGGNVYLRVIYNGEDVTASTIPCAGLTARAPHCPFRIFKEFIDKDLKEEFEDACKA
ncbi:putative 2-phosphoxylose phosphatase 1 [Hypsibius exemplaris]|uniref:2-phosphoxylose phosphatase 1 n=1 Tax=Hypsibius exemplaris TaxID=2072580 RepID=A0A1W0WPK6_HYPEX|nr:putative 2-phosphoxylose phosphatase 1 [Hypsibius exemplaris]